ncbi:MAG: phage tail protein [Oscillospiraceae bacterium]
MYIVTIDGQFFFGTGKYDRPGYELINPQVDLAVNAAGTFTFTMYPSHPCYELTDNTKSIVQIVKDGEAEPLFRGRVLSTELGFYNEKKVICEGELAFLCDTIQQNYDYSEGESRKTIHELLSFFIQRHNEKAGIDNIHSFKIGIVNVTDGDNSNTDNLISAADSTFLNTYESIQQKLIERYGGYLYIRHEEDGNYIDYLSSPSVTCSQKIELGENLLSFKKNIEADSLVTAVIPLGKERMDGGEEGSGSRHNIGGWNASQSITDSKDIFQVTGKVGGTTTYLNCLYSQSAVEKYGWIEKVLIFDDVVLPGTLVRYGESHLKSMGKALSIELTAADLSGVNTEIDRFKIAQYVRVNSKPHNLENALYVVSKLSLNLTDPTANKICLGTETATITGQISNSVSTVSSSSTGGGGGSYDESGSASAALKSAKEYTDTRCADTLQSAKNYSDSKAADTLNSSESYTDIKTSEILKSANDYTDSRFTDEEKDKLAGIAENANNYVHPEFPTLSSGIYKMQVNNGHVSRAVKAEKADILALGFEDPAAAYLPLTGGTISNSNYGESLKVNRGPTSSSAALSVIDYLINGNRVGVMGFDSDSKLRIRNSNNTEMAEIDKDGTVSAKYFKQSQSGTLLAESSTDENSLTVTNAEIAKYSLLYMAASWTQQETVNFCDVIPISAIAAGAVFTKQVYTGTRIYTYTVTCTSAGVFTLTQTNSTGTAGTLRLKLYVI